MNPEDSRKDCAIDPKLAEAEILLTRPTPDCDTPPIQESPVFVKPTSQRPVRPLPNRLPPSILLKSPRVEAYCHASTGLISSDPGISEFGSGSIPVFWENAGVEQDGSPADITLSATASRLFLNEELYRLTTEVAAPISGVDPVVDGSHPAGTTFSDLVQALFDAYLLSALSASDFSPLQSAITKLVFLDQSRVDKFLSFAASQAGVFSSTTDVVFKDISGSTLSPTDPAATTGIYAFALIAAESSRSCLYGGRYKWVCAPPATQAAIAPGDHYVTGKTQEEADTATLSWWSSQPAIQACAYHNAAIDISCPAGTLTGEVVTLADTVNGSTTPLVTRVTISSPVNGAVTVRTYVDRGVGASPSQTFEVREFTSLTSQAAATALAQEYAGGLMRCLCGSTGAAAYCDVYDSTPVSSVATSYDSIPSPAKDRLLAMAAENPDRLSSLRFSPVEDMVLISGSGLVAEIDSGQGLSLFTQQVSYNASGAAVTAATAIAQQELETWLRTWLVCQWYSPERKCSCISGVDGIEAYKFSELAISTLPVTPKSHADSPIYTLAEGQFTEDDTGVAPDWEMLSSWCVASLDCNFCNTQIDPICHIANGTDANNPVATDIYSGTPPLQVPTGEVGVATNITRGAQAAVVCGQDPFSIAARAQAVADTPPEKLSGGSEPQCLYANERMTVTCKQKACRDGGGGTDSACSWLDPDTYPTTANGNLYIAALHSLSKVKTIDIPAGLFSVPSTESLSPVDAFKAAQLAAREYGFKVLNCEYTNPALKIYCGASRPTDIPASTYYSPSNYFENGNGEIEGVGVACCSTGRKGSAGNCVNNEYWDPAKTCPADTALVVAYDSVKSVLSPLDAYQNAYDSKASMLDCFFTAKYDKLCEEAPDAREVMYMSLENFHPPTTSIAGSFPSDPNLAGIDFGGLSDGSTGQVSLYAIYDYKLGKFKTSSWTGTYAIDMFGDQYSQAFKTYRTSTHQADTVYTGRALSYISQGDATSEAQDLAANNIVCQYANWSRKLDCPTGTVPGGKFSAFLVPTGTYLAASTTEANIMAEQQVQASVQCMQCTGHQIIAGNDTEGFTNAIMCGGGAVRVGGAPGAPSDCFSSCKAKTIGNSGRGDPNAIIVYDGRDGKICPTAKFHPKDRLVTRISSANRWIDIWIQTTCCLADTGGEHELKNILRMSDQHHIDPAGILPGNPDYMPEPPKKFPTGTFDVDDATDTTSIWTYLGSVGRLKEDVDANKPSQPIAIQATIGDIYLSCASGSAERPPWDPEFFTDGTLYKCRFNLGTVNQVPAANWDEVHTLDKDVRHFVVLRVSSTKGKVTGAQIMLMAEAPSAGEVAKNIPPVRYEIVLGVIDHNSKKMVIKNNLNMLPSVVFKESVQPPAGGGEAFVRWWGWTVSAI